MGTRGLLLGIMATAMSVVPPAVAQDPLPLYPENYKVLMENDRVRVLDFRLQDGSSEKSHSHPAHVVYVVAPFKVRFTFPDGRTGIREARAGDVLFSEAVTHATENIGGTNAHGLLVELKSADAAPADALTAVTFIRGPEGKEAEIKRELLSLTAPTRAEPGALRYDLYQSVVRPSDFMRFEVWRNPEALELHKASAHLKASFERRKDQGWLTDITLWMRVPD
jgi:quinol monooxygenase YgiN/quercetin dioxygenase-like cupin family protein